MATSISPCTPPRTSSSNKASLYPIDSNKVIGTYPDSPLDGLCSRYALTSTSTSILELAPSAPLIPSLKTSNQSRRNSEGTRTLNLFTKAAFAESRDQIPPPTPTLEKMELINSPNSRWHRKIKPIPKTCLVYLPSPDLPEVESPNGFYYSDSDTSYSSSFPSPKSIRLRDIDLPTAPSLKNKRSRLNNDTSSRESVISITERKLNFIDASWPCEEEIIYGGWSEEPTLGLGLLGM